MTWLGAALVALLAIRPCVWPARTGIASSLRACRVRAALAAGPRSGDLERLGLAEPVTDRRVTKSHICCRRNSSRTVAIAGGPAPMPGVLRAGTRPRRTAACTEVSHRIRPRPRAGHARRRGGAGPIAPDRAVRRPALRPVPPSTRCRGRHAGLRHLARRAGRPLSCGILLRNTHRRASSWHGTPSPLARTARTAGWLIVAPSWSRPRRSHGPSPRIVLAATLGIVVLRDARGSVSRARLAIAAIVAIPVLSLLPMQNVAAGGNGGASLWSLYPYLWPVRPHGIRPRMSAANTARPTGDHPTRRDLRAIPPGTYVERTCRRSLSSARGCSSPTSPANWAWLAILLGGHRRGGGAACSPVWLRNSAATGADSPAVCPSPRNGASTTRRHCRSVPRPWRWAHDGLSRLASAFLSTSRWNVPGCSCGSLRWLPYCRSRIGSSETRVGLEVAREGLLHIQDRDRRPDTAFRGLRTPYAERLHRGLVRNPPDYRTALVWTVYDLGVENARLWPWRPGVPRTCTTSDPGALDGSGAASSLESRPLVARGAHALARRGPRVSGRRGKPW